MYIGLCRDVIEPLIPQNGMDIQQAAEYLGLSTSHINSLIRKKIIPTLKGKGAGKTPFNRIRRQKSFVIKRIC